MYIACDVITEDALRLAGGGENRRNGRPANHFGEGNIKVRRADGVLTGIASASIGPAFVQSLIKGFDKLYTLCPRVKGGRDKGAALAARHQRGGISSSIVSRPVIPKWRV